MSSENDSILEKETTDSDDGFEVLDPEPEQDPDDFNCLSRTEFANAGTIMFCHMDDEYNNIRQVRCQYIRPEGWSEKEKDVIAIFEVGWINIEEAIAKLPVDLTVSKGYPLGSVNLEEFSFPKEDYEEFPGAVSHFQFCYLRDGVLLGASTPFSVKGIKAVGRIPLMGDKPLFLSGERPPSQLFSGDKDSAQILYESAKTASIHDTSAIIIPPIKLSHDNIFLKNEAVHEMGDGAVGVELSAMQNTLRNLTILTKRLKNRMHDKHTSEYTAELILELNDSIDELTAEIHKRTGDMPQVDVIAPSPASCEDLEQAFRSCAAKLKANLQDCTRTFDLCKVAIKNQTPPSSLSEFERFDFVRETEWKRQQELEELKKRFQEAADEVKIMKGMVLLKETRHDELEKELMDARDKLKTTNEELARMEICNDDLNHDLQKTVSELLSMKEERHLKEINQEDLKRNLEETETVLQAVREDLKQIQDAGVKVSLKENEMKCQLYDKGKQLEEVMEELSLKEANHQNYVAEVEKEKKQTEARMDALTAENAVLKSQIQSLLDEAKLYKSKLGDTILELTNTRREADSLKEQCTKFVQDLNFMEADKKRLMDCIAALKEEIEKKGQSMDSVADTENDILVQEFLKKSEELNVAKQQVEDFKDELSRLNIQRTSLQKELSEAREKPAVCEKPCCTFEITPVGHHPEHVVQSILEALEQSIQQNKQLEKDLDAEKKRYQVLEEKLQIAAGKHRTLYMDKISLEAQVKKLRAIHMDSLTN